MCEGLGLDRDEERGGVVRVCVLRFLGLKEREGSRLRAMISVTILGFLDSVCYFRGAGRGKG